ncbi:MAG TPA: DUF3999 family protein [Flavobacterium sp.]|jgi:hypothetical protein
MNFKILSLLLLSNFLFAQPRLRGNIEPVESSGLYKIQVPPKVRSFAGMDLHSFRIYDSQKQEVPYFVFPATAPPPSGKFYEYRVISRVKVPGKYSNVVFENTADSLRSISLFINNADVVKKYSISGSNDLKEWFGLINNGELHDLSNPDSTAAIKTISLPLSAYRYIKIQLDDKKTLPINISKAGNFTNTYTDVAFEEVVPEEITTTQSGKKTLIYIRFKYPELAERLSIEVPRPSYFVRQARIFTKSQRQIRRKIKWQEDDLAAFEINSAAPRTFSLPQIFTNEFWIEISNGDSPPLQISKLTFTRPVAAVAAELQPNEKYTITAGDPKLSMPDYDLSNLKDILPVDIPEAKITSVTIAEAEIEVRNRQFWEQKWFMWTCIVLGGIAIAIFSAGLLRDMKQEK